MPKIDTNNIAGFADMSVEQKLQAIMDLDIPEAVDLSQYVKKTVFDAKAHEASELNKKLQGKLSDDEKAQSEREQRETEQINKYTELESKYNELLKKSTLSEYKAKYIASGYTPELAEKAANAIVSGKMDDLFSAQQEHAKILEQTIKEQFLQDSKGPDGFSGGNNKLAPNELVAQNIGKERADADKRAREAMAKFLK